MVTPTKGWAITDAPAKRQAPVPKNAPSKVDDGASKTKKSIKLKSIKLKPLKIPKSPTILSEN